METLFAEALFDNIADSGDELAFRKGDIIVVLDSNVAGNTGWWKCSLHGCQGMAPANRLRPLSTNFGAERESLGTQSLQSIYQTPKAVMPSPVSTAHSKSGSDIYDVPSLPSPLQPLQSKTSLSSTTEEHERHEMLDSARCPNAIKKNDCTIPPLITNNPTYDIPMPSISENIQNPPYGYSTMPNPCKSERIYRTSVPVFPQKQGDKPCHFGTMPSKHLSSNNQLYDTPPAHVWSERKQSPTQPLYDIPKPSKIMQSCKDSCTYDIPPCLRQSENSAHSVMFPRQQTLPETDSNKSNEPLQCWGKPRPINDQLHRWPPRGRTMSRQLTEGAIRRDDNNDSQRSSTASTPSTASSSSSSSCDTFMLSSPEPKLLREVTLSQEEAGKKLLELQESVCQSVSKLLMFVSSNWRCKEHLGQHLQQIHTAAEDVTDSVTCFINFALDVRGNAQRLTDLNLQTRLLKQLSVVEDSGLILQLATDALRDLGWLLETLAQDAGHSQTPDHLERFIMVARTVPEDVKRLVSILNANGKLIFRATPKETDTVEHVGPSNRSLCKSDPMVDSGINESDYVQLQVSISQSMSPSPLHTSKKPSLSDHCRLYFGAIQKAISLFLCSLTDGQPPEKFMSHSKLVIMVGQRLVNTLRGEAESREASQEILSIINQLCAHLKQLAMVTKKSALSFPDKLALQEAQDSAKELAQRVQDFRISLDI
ncbi:cas scaffolding protein family member 4-like isoform X2 [Xyrauchen texanus]|uniref:cas scaffolding protein family member 4-like isoform X2 n=1 Tax=Xyrauchen texanus TaxID=154827 RepID=UPI0022420E04|nr:cas scaffolding protein family member 4-like isoform X2 [Xyrauchen texanus]